MIFWMRVLQRSDEGLRLIENVRAIKSLNLPCDVPVGKGTGRNRLAGCVRNTRCGEPLESLVALMTNCIARADERLQVFSCNLPYREPIRLRRQD